MPLINLDIEEPARAISYVTRRLTQPDDIALIASLLDVAAGLIPADRPITSRQFDLLKQHRVLGLIPSTWKVDVADLSSERAALLAQQMALSHVAHEVSDVLHQHGIDHRVLKGMATAALDYPNPSQRTFGDIDMLVRRCDFERALRALASDGTVRRSTERSIEFTKGSALTSARGLEVDLHYRLTHTASGNHRLFASPCSVPNTQYTALPPHLRLLHAAAHLMLSSPGARRISGLADISAIRARHTIDLDAVQHEARLLNCEPAVGAALVIERTIRGIPPDTMHWRSASFLERSSYLRCSDNMLGYYAFRIAMLKGISERARFIQELAIPNLWGSLRRDGLSRVAQRLRPQSFGGPPPRVEI